MASTNKTINYNLSQYVANDKPTYLVDYNSDMNKIDTQMKANSDLAGLAKSEADDLSSRVDGQDVIIGTLNTTVGQHTSDISTLNADVSAVDTKVGDLTNLNTTDKTDIVNAVNEVNTKVGDLTNLNTTAKSNVVSAVNEVNSKKEVFSTNEVKTNKVWIDGKPIYRKCYVIPKSATSGEIIIYNTGINDIDIITKLEGVIKRTDDQFDIIPCNLTNNAYLSYFGDATRQSIQINIGSSLYANVFDTLYMTIEYTKTTD